MDYKQITKLADIMLQYGLTKLEVSEKDSTISLGRDNTAPAAHAAAPATAAQQQAPAAMEDDGPEPIFIKSPMPGTFYSATSPTAKPFVQPGSIVHANTVVCIVEAMKVMNEVKAEVDGKIIRCLVEDGAAVEYGQPMFEII